MVCRSGRCLRGNADFCKPCGFYIAPKSKVSFSGAGGVLYCFSGVPHVEGLARRALAMDAGNINLGLGLGQTAMTGPI